MQYLSDFASHLTPQMIFFFVFAAIAVGSALEVVMQRNPLYSAIALVVTFAALAANYVMLDAQFIAVIQIVVYAGAIIVLFLFVIMLLNVRAEESRLDRYGALRWVAAPALAVVFLGVFFVIRTSKLDTVAQSAASARIGTVGEIGRGLFTSYLLPFEAASVLIMMALVGALVLAQRAAREVVRTDAPETARGPAPPTLPEREEVEV